MLTKIVPEEYLHEESEVHWFEKETLKLHLPRWTQVRRHHFLEGSGALTCGHHFPQGTMALLTTPESAATECICESFQSTVSSGTVGRQLAGEKAHGKTCLISLG